MEMASTNLRPILIVAPDTGMRRGEILRLRWRDLDFDWRFILIEYSKSGKSRKVPMNDLVFDALKDRKRENEFVIHTRDPKRPIHAVRDVKTAFMGACRRAGIDSCCFFKKIRPGP